MCFPFQNANNFFSTKYITTIPLYKNFYQESTYKQKKNVIPLFNFFFFFCNISATDFVTLMTDPVYSDKPTGNKNENSNNIYEDPKEGPKIQAWPNPAL